MTLVALDVALLPPAEVAALALRLNGALPRETSQGLVLDDHHLPHITLTQQFVFESDLDRVLAGIEQVVDRAAPIILHAPAGGMSRNTVWITIDRSAALQALHEQLMMALLPFERHGGGPSAFYEGDARPGDVQWVTGYRRQSAFSAYTPHITLGHAGAPPVIEPFDFEARVVAACHLGRFCTCRKALKTWGI